MSTIPQLGAGLGFRRDLAAETYAARHQIDFVEIITEEFTRGRRDLDRLRELTAAFSVIPHGVGLSIGSMGRLDRGHLAGIKTVSDLTGSPYYSDHLCMTRAPGIDLGHLAPLWFDGEVLRNTIDRVSEVQDELGKPLILENVTLVCNIPGAEMTQAEFFRRLVEATGCGVLLDVTNLYINSVNHRFDPVEFMDALPLDHVVQVHLAGGHRDRGILIDSHAHPVPAAVWELFALLCERADVKGALIEHDQNFPAFDRLLGQVTKARQIMANATAKGTSRPR